MPNIFVGLLSCRDKQLSYLVWQRARQKWRKRGVEDTCAGIISLNYLTLLIKSTVSHQTNFVWPDSCLILILTYKLYAMRFSSLSFPMHFPSSTATFSPFPLFSVYYQCTTSWHSLLSVSSGHLWYMLLPAASLPLTALCLCTTPILKKMGYCVN